MPRNGSGTYSLPAGNPVVSGTTIQASWANGTLADMSTELTGSLARSGAGGMLGALRGVDGTVSVPAFSFTSETTAGFYRAGTGDVRFAMAGADVYTVTISAVTFALPVVLAAGTASAPSLAATGDLNTGVWFPAADTIALSTGGSERVRLDASGNLGLGVVPSAWSGSGGKNIEVGATGNALFGSASLTAYTSNANFDSSWKYSRTGFASRYEQQDSNHRWFTAPSGTAGNAISFTQAMTLTSGGNLLVGTTSNPSNARVNIETTGIALIALGGATAGASFQNTSSSFEAGQFWNKATSGDNVFVAFYTETSAAGRGTIDYNRAGGLVRYNTTSDYRAKDIIGPVQDPGATIDALKVYEGVMKGATQSRPMLVAHEAQAHAPYAVSGVKDEVNEDGTPKFQQMDVSSLVPLLLAEIQSLRARVAALEA